MKRFRFSLQSLLQLRNHQKEMAAQAWMKALANLQAAVNATQKALASLQAWQRTHRLQAGDRILARDLIRNQQATQGFYHQWINCERIRKAMEHRAREVLSKWNEARRKEEILERIKNRRRAQWQKECDLEEQKINDERAGILAFYNSKNRRLAQT
ncbi:MAG: hypothetical protein PHV34_17035 [Verrucomicrobiae bacterium]|nr:hypothetical protein [Verrucomicrobiae bacterium]